MWITCRGVRNCIVCKLCEPKMFFPSLGVIGCKTTEVLLYTFIYEITSSPISPDPLLCLLGFVKHCPDASLRLTAMLLVLARCRVSMCWGRRPAPRVALWLEDASPCQTLLSEFWYLLSARPRPIDIWGPLVSYLLNHDSQHPTSSPVPPRRPGGGGCRRRSMSRLFSAGVLLCSLWPPSYTHHASLCCIFHSVYDPMTRIVSWYYSYVL